ncbi:MAG: hypothetical protein KBI46_01535 [Phycisphaerae bacterium]|nr:hypothetical protein [Phycisphaerae bacterium]
MDTFPNSPEAVLPFVFIGCYMFVILLITVLTVIIFCRIFAKAGYHWALGLITLIPIGNIIMLLILAFSEWPIQRQLRTMQQAQATSQLGQLHPGVHSL